MDLIDFDPADEPQTYDVDLLAAGLPRLKSTAAVGRTRDASLELELVRATIFLMHGVQPKMLLLDNVPDLVTSDAYTAIRSEVEAELDHLGYSFGWLVANAVNFGVPQERKHGVLVALKGDGIDAFELPDYLADVRLAVGHALHHSMAAGGWSGVEEWAAQADHPAPTLVGGSWDRGGADLGPTGSKRAWARMGVDGATVADAVPGPDFVWDPTVGRSGMVKLTVEQAAILQGFPTDWRFAGKKTSRYRQVGNAMPPPLARALGLAAAELMR